MKLFDAHCHLVDSEAFERAAAADVEGIAVCGTSPDDWADCIDAHRHFQASEKYPQITPMIGIHPWFVHCRAGSVTPPETAPKLRGGYSWKKEFQCLEKLLWENPKAGIGETGLDLREQFDNHTEQEACFIAHLDLAHELNRPVAVHCVKAWGKLLEILQEHPAPAIIMHAYSGSVELMDQLTKLNCWFSFGEAVMNPKFKRARKAVAAASPERLLIETDSGGEPEKLKSVARAVAELRGAPVEQIAERTFHNATSLFNRKSS